eukprot:8833206-Karenia_brevis.AAC.1
MSSGTTPSSALHFQNRLFEKVPWWFCPGVHVNDCKRLVSPLPVPCDFKLEPLHKLVSVVELRTLVGDCEVRRMFLDVAMGDVQVFWLQAEIFQQQPPQLEAVCMWLEK